MGFENSKSIIYKRINSYSIFNSDFIVSDVLTFAVKRWVFLFAVLVMNMGLQAQHNSTNKSVANLKAFDEKPIHFGFLIGLNTMNFNIQHSGFVPSEIGGKASYAELLSIQPGINLGIITSFKVRKNLNLRVLPGISFGQRDLSYIFSDGEKVEDELKIKSTFLEMPIMLKYGADRNHNFKPYVVAGVNPRFDLAKKKQSGLLLNAFDLYYEVGVGFDSYLNYFRLSTELKISIGMSDVLNHSGTGQKKDLAYTQAIDRLTSRIFVLSFYFE